MPRGIPSKPTELCPFCGALFVTGLERGDHLLAAHKEAMDALKADVEDSKVEAGRV